MGKGRYASARLSLALLLLLGDLMAAALGGALSQHNHEVMEQAAVRIVRGINQNLSEDVQSFLGYIDLQMGMLAEELGRRNASDTEKAEAFTLSHRAIERLGNRYGFEPEVLVVDAAGKPILPEGVAMSAVEDFTRAGLLSRLRDQADPHLQLLIPGDGAASGQPMMLLGRRLSDDHGDFAGAMLMSIPVEALGGIASALDFGEGLFFVVASSDLSRVINAKGGEAAVSQLMQPELRQRLLALGKDGGLLTVEMRGSSYLVLSQPLFGQPVQFLTAYDRKVYLAGWHRGNWGILGVLLLFFFGTGMVYRLHGRNLRKIETERSHLRSLVSAIPEPVWLKDPDGIYIAANPEFQRMVGVPDIEQLLGKTDYDLYPPDEADFFRDRDRIAAANNGPTVNEEWVTFGDGSREMLETIKTPMREDDGRLLGILGISRIITDREKAKEIGRLYAILSQADRAAITSASIGDLFNRICEICVSHGFTMVWVGMTCDDQMVHPVAWAGQGVEYLDGLLISVMPGSPSSTGPTGQAFLGGQPVICNDFANDPRTLPWRSQGRRFGWGASAAVPFHQDGNTKGVLTLYSHRRDFFDAAKIRLLEDLAGTAGLALQRFSMEQQQRDLNESLRVSEAQFSSIFHASPVAIALLEFHSGQVIDVNEAFSKAFGLSRLDVVGAPFHGLLLFSDKAEADRLGLLGPPSQAFDTQPVLCRDRDGGKLDMLLSVEFIDSRAGRLSIVMLSDVTELRRAERALVQAELERVHMMRLGMLGEVASAIAHEVNQPIGAAANYLQTAMMILGETPAAEMLNKAEAQILRASATIKRVREFAANRETAPAAPEDLAPMLQEGCALGLLGEAGQGVRLSMHLPEDLPKVLVDRLQLEQVVTNLARNAAEAMRGCADKIIDIRARVNDEGRVEVTIADSGPGIAPEVVDRLFKPFTTTKADGTGLGLSISRAIIRACGGELWVESLPGACFHFTLPVEDVSHG